MEEKKKKPEDIDKIIDQRIDREIDSILASKKLEEELDKRISRKIEEKLESRMEKKLEEYIPAEPKVEEVTEKEVKENPITRAITIFKTDFHLCWQGSCRTISLVMLLTYLLVIIVLLFCTLSRTCGVNNSSVSVFISLAIVAASIFSLVYSFFSKYPRTALIFWIILDIPLIIFLLIFTARYIGLILIALIILTRLIQSARGRGY